MDGIDADFAGLSADADERLSSEQLVWADIVAVMERRHLARLKRQYGPLLRGKRVVCLNIPDRFGYGDTELVRRLQPELRRILRRPS